jgi:hypothetical protein
LLEINNRNQELKKNITNFDEKKKQVSVKLNILFTKRNEDSAPIRGGKKIQLFENDKK